MTSILDSLAARYAHWLSLPDADTVDVSDEDPNEVRVMPLVLRLERDAPPARTAVLAAAAAASVAVCLDPRSTPGGEWHDDVRAWVSSRIRKVARRARGAHWRAVADLPGVTVRVGGAEVRALVPGRVVDTPKEVARLQISGSDLPPDEPPAPAGDLPVLYLNPHVPMTVGKAAAQVGHASMLLAALLAATGGADALAAWASIDYRCQVRPASTAEWDARYPADDPAGAWRDRGVVVVRDAGFTEIAPGTVTVVATWPRPADGPMWTVPARA